jgi:hypothetical protein
MNTSKPAPFGKHQQLTILLAGKTCFRTVAH